MAVSEQARLVPGEDAAALVSRGARLWCFHRLRAAWHRRPSTHTRTGPSWRCVIGPCLGAAQVAASFWRVTEVWGACVLNVENRSFCRGSVSERVSQTAGQGPGGLGRADGLAGCRPCGMPG